MKKNLVLLGMMGVGKTTLGKIVAKKQGLKFIDTDEIIENRNLMKISEIFEKKGEKFFRIEEEKEVLSSLQKNQCVIALGGGAFINKKVRKCVLNKAVSIWLDESIKTLIERIQRSKKRPLLNNTNSHIEIQKIYDERKNIYKLANYRIDCKNLSKEKILKKILSYYEKHSIDH